MENLRGSGMIAGESSLAYDEIVTISLVSRLLLYLFIFFECLNFYYRNFKIVTKVKRLDEEPHVFHRAASIVISMQPFLCQSLCPLICNA